jgi:inhibitor of KinA
LTSPYAITLLNESAVLVSFGNNIDPSVNEKIISFHQLLNSKPFKGFVESVPAYSSIAVFYSPPDVIQVNANYKPAFDIVKEHLENALAQLSSLEVQETNQLIEVPVLYDGEDLPLVAELHQLTAHEVITIHTAQTYRVFMIGFLPGFPYLGTVNEKIATSRKSSPRTVVPAGSVGIAGYQTGIYPQSSPGGWQLIGRTPVKIFDTKKSSPCLFKPGDSVRFYAIDENEFQKRNEY